MTATAVRPAVEVPIPGLSGGRAILGHAVEFYRDPMAFLERGWRQLGEVFEFRVALRRFVFFGGPPAHDAFFRAPDDQLSAKEVYAFTIPIFGKGIAYDVPESVMEQQVGFLYPALRDERMRTYARHMREEVIRSSDVWGEKGEIDLPAVTNELTMNIACRCLLGEEIRERLDSRFAALYHALQGGINAVGFFAPRLPTPAHQRRDRARREVVRLLSGILAERRRTGRQGEDLMQTLMEARYQDGRALTDDEIAGILLTALFSGQHTSGVLAAWVGVELLQHPEFLALILEELETVYHGGRELSQESLKEQVQLEHSVREAERLHPPLILLVRKVLREFRYGPYRVPPGRLALVSPGFAHRLPTVFGDPHRYDPGRFAAPREEGRQPHALISFGGGKHRCIGLHFAYLQVKAIWSVLLSRFEFELASPTPAPDYGSWVTGPRAPCRVRYRRRRQPLTGFAS